MRAAIFPHSLGIAMILLAVGCDGAVPSTDKSDSRSGAEAGDPNAESLQMTAPSTSGPGAGACSCIQQTVSFDNTYELGAESSGFGAGCERIAGGRYNLILLRTLFSQPSVQGTYPTEAACQEALGSLLASVGGEICEGLKDDYENADIINNCVSDWKSKVAGGTAGYPACLNKAQILTLGTPSIDCRTECEDVQDDSGRGKACVPKLIMKCSGTAKLSCGGTSAPAPSGSTDSSTLGK